MLPLFRCTTLFLCVSVCGFGSQSYSAAAPTPADQLPLKYTALLGGQVHIGGLAVDAGGNAFISGTASSALPVTAGAFQTEYKPATCTSYFPQSPPQTFPCPVAFAGKLSHDGTALVYLTYLGTSNSNASGISVDGQGDAWVTGTISSSDLPVTPGALQTTPKGPQNVFVLKLNPTGSRVLFATYLGGSGSSTVPASQTIDTNGNIYVTGSTGASDFPVSPGAFQTDVSQSSSVLGTSFVTKFDAGGRLVYSTYFHGGDASNTYTSSIAADAAGNAYITGDSGGSLPTTPGAFQTSAGAQEAAFVAKLDAKGSTLLYCTYLGANSPVGGSEISVDNQGNAYVAGGIQLGTPGLVSSFPVTPGAFQTAPPVAQAVGGLDSFEFIAKLNAAGSALVYSTFLYASDDTWISSLAVDASGSVVAVGQTYALDFPTTPGALRQCNPLATWGATGFLLTLAADGSQLGYSTFLGTDGADASLIVAFDGNGEAYISGNSLGSLPVVPGSFGWTGSGPFIAGLAPLALPAGSVSCVVSAASRGGPAIAPGEIVDIFGNGIGPVQTVFATVSSGHIGTSLGGVQVSFNGVLAPLLSADPNQIRAVVPFETDPSAQGGSGSATIQILNSSTPVQPLTAPVAVLAPTIFTVDGRPAGQALMINEDGTLNSEKNPAPQGSIVTIYATGLNNTQPALVTGAIAPGAAPLAVQAELQVGSTGFGQGEITYAGAAPGFVAGLTQINFRLPASIFHGFTDLYLSMSDSFISQTGVYFYLQ